MKKKERRSLEEILNSLKDAEKEYDEKLDKYGMKVVKTQKPEEANTSETDEVNDISNGEENPSTIQEQSTDNNENINQNDPA